MPVKRMEEYVSLSNSQKHEPLALEAGRCIPTIKSESSNQKVMAARGLFWPQVDKLK